MKSKPYVLSVGALVWNPEGRILLLRRSDDSKHFPDQWEPPGGKTVPGEEAGETILREVREETGLEIDLDGVAGAAEFELAHLRVAMLYFHAHVREGVPRISPEHSEFRWVSLTDLATIPLTEPFRSLASNTTLSPQRLSHPPQQSS